MAPSNKSLSENRLCRPERESREQEGRTRFYLPVVCLSLFLIMCTPASNPVVDYSPVIEKLTAFIKYEMEDKDLPAFSIALTDDRETVWSAGFGAADPDLDVPATGDTVYRVASVSKLFTALAVMQAVEQGVLDPDEPISTYVPDLTFQNPFDQPITLRHLLSHRSGIIREPPVGSYFDPTEPGLEAMIQSLDGTPLIYEPGTRTKYSNAAVSLAGYILQQATGRPHPDIIREQILAPLGMNDTSFEPRSDLKARLAKGTMWGYDGRTFEAPVFELGIGPAANLYTTMNDLTRFLRMLFAGGQTPDGRQLVDPASLEFMWTPQFTDDKTGFGLGFYVDDFDGRRRIQHSGVMYGYATRVYGLPEEKLGAAAVATLDAVNVVVDRIGSYALQLMLAHRVGEPLPDFPRTMPVSPVRAQILAGRYQSEDGSTLDLYEHQGRLLYDDGVSLVNLNALGSDTLIVDDRLAHGTRLIRAGRDLKLSEKRYTRIDVPKPAAPPEILEGLIGEYGWDHNILYIQEKEGQLYALIEWFFRYPLTQIDDNTYAFPDHGLYMGEKLFFRRDASGRAYEVEAAHVVWERRNIEPDKGPTFKIDPVRPVAELRDVALTASPPEENGSFRTPELVELTELDPSIQLDIRYATTNNFMNAVFYDEPRAFMQQPAAEALVRVHHALKEQGFGLLIHDAYRPWYVTKMFWDATPGSMKQFVANPADGSRHNRGCAVDLTLYDLETGQPVTMVSGYDEFTERAYADYPGGTGRQRWLRQVLRQAMEAEGFRVYPYEWWHFDYKDWRAYPILNHTFDQIEE